MKTKSIIILMILVNVAVACKKTESGTSSLKKSSDLKGKIIAVGDSITWGQGVGESNTYPAQLQQKLLADGRKYKVYNAGFCGETTGELLARIDEIVSLNPDIVILATGGNDGWQHVNSSVMENNFDQIITKLKANNVIIVFGGMKMPRSMKKEYYTQFDAVYPRVAKKYNLIFVPWFLKDVALRKKLNQSDRIHPTREGYEIIVKNLYPYVIEAINVLEKK